MATATRISPGIYEVDGKRYTAKDSATALKMAQAAPKPGQAAKPLPQGQTAQPISQQAAKTNYTDPKQVAQLQTNEAQSTAVTNANLANADQSNPFGSSTTTVDPTTGKATYNSQLTGANKDLYDAESGADTMGARIAQGYLGQAPQQGYNANSVDAQGYGIPKVDQNYINQYQDAAYKNLTKYTDQDYAKDKEAKAQELVNRGIPQGSEQFQQEMDRSVNRGYNEQKANAANQAYSAGLGAAQTNFGMGLQANQQAVSNLQSNYTLPTSLAANLTGIGQGYQAPGTQYQATQKANVDYGGIYNTATGAKLKNQEFSNNLAVARMRSSGGGGSNSDSGPNYV